MMELNRIYNEDCFEGMKRIPDGSVDLIVTDPPYGTLELEWDKPIDIPAMFKEFLRVSKKKCGDRDILATSIRCRFDQYSAKNIQIRVDLGEKFCSRIFKCS